MLRRITGFRQDDEGGWAAELSCLHGQHIRHKPPFQLAPWVLVEAERDARIGAPLECPLCDRAELPGDLHEVRTTDTWDNAPLPAGHWALVRVGQGTVRVTAATSPPLDAVIEPGHPQAIPPEVDHAVEPAAGAQFVVEVLTRPPA